MHFKGCIDCPDRKLIKLEDGRETTCHSFCEPYKKAAAEQERINKNIVRERQLWGRSAAFESWVTKERGERI